MYLKDITSKYFEADTSPGTVAQPRHPRLRHHLYFLSNAQPIRMHCNDERLFTRARTICTRCSANFRVRYACCNRRIRRRTLRTKITLQRRPPKDSCARTHRARAQL